MTGPKRVTKRQAAQVLGAVKKQFAMWIDNPEHGPQLEMDYDWGPTGPVPSIVWEGGPFAWAHMFPHGTDGLPEEEFGTEIKPVTLPAGVWVEPYNSWAICIYSDMRP